MVWITGQPAFLEVIGYLKEMATLELVEKIKELSRKLGSVNWYLKCQYPNYLRDNNGLGNTPYPRGKTFEEL